MPRHIKKKNGNGNGNGHEDEKELTREALKELAQAYYDKHGTLAGFGDQHRISDGEGFFRAKTKGPARNGTGKRVSIVPTADRAKSDAKKAEAIAQQTVEGAQQLTRKPKGLQRHHQRMVDLYAPFFEGLNDKEAQELAQWFLDEGAPLGDTPGNPVDMRQRDHNAIHTWMRQNGIEVSAKKRPSFAHLTLNERLVPALEYLKYVQGGVDEQLQMFDTFTPRTLPVETKALDIDAADGAIKLKRLKMTALAGAGLATYGAFGTAASAAETVGRAQIASKTMDPADIAQTGLSAASLLGDGIAYIPTPVTQAIGNGLSMAADGGNMLIDGMRSEETRKTIEKVVSDPMNEIEYWGKKGLKMLGGAVRYW